MVDPLTIILGSGEDPAVTRKISNDCERRSWLFNSTDALDSDIASKKKKNITLFSDPNGRWIRWRGVDFTLPCDHDVIIRRGRAIEAHPRRTNSPTLSNTVRRCDPATPRRSGRAIKSEAQTAVFFVRDVDAWFGASSIPWDR